MNGSKARPLLIFFGREKIFAFKVSNLIICFDFNVSWGCGLLKAQPLQAFFIVAAAIGDLIAFDLAAEQYFFVWLADFGWDGDGLRCGRNWVETKKGKN